MSNKINSKFIYIRLKHFFYRFVKPKFLYFLLKKKKPLSDIYGLERGVPVDRYYIENFLNENKELVKGDCLELLNNDYTIKYGRKNVSKSDILDIDVKNQKATIFSDLKKLDNVFDNSYDCIILTQVLQFIDDYESAISECKRVLKPGGSLLVTLPSIGRIDCASGLDGDYWRFTEASAKYIFSKYFMNEKLKIESKGNVLSGLYFWIGASQEELSDKKLDYLDKNFPIIITVRAIK